MTEPSEGDTAVARREATPPAGRPANIGIASAIERMSPEQLAVITDTVARGATRSELAMFLELANRYQLDPWAREIWCICEMERDGRRKVGQDGRPKAPMIMTSRDGYLAVANRHPAFEGMHSDVIREGDTFRVTMRVGEAAGVEHSYGAKRGPIIGAYALVARRDRSRVAYFFAPWEDYGKNKAAGSEHSSWRNYPSAMILKVAEAMALRRAFSISGLVTQEEVDAGDVPERPPVTRIEPTPEERADQVREGFNPLDVLVELYSDLGRTQVVAELEALGAKKMGDLRREAGRIVERLDAAREELAQAAAAADEEPLEGEVVPESPGDDAPIAEGEPDTPVDPEGDRVPDDRVPGAPGYGREPA